MITFEDDPCVNAYTRIAPTSRRDPAVCAGQRHGRRHRSLAAAAAHRRRSLARSLETGAAAVRRPSRRLRTTRAPAFRSCTTSAGSRSTFSSTTTAPSSRRSISSTARFRRRASTRSPSASSWPTAATPALSERLSRQARQGDLHDQRPPVPGLRVHQGADRDDDLRSASRWRASSPTCRRPIRPTGGDEQLWGSVSGDVREYAGYLGHYHVTRAEMGSGPLRLQIFRVARSAGASCFPSCSPATKPDVPEDEGKAEDIAQTRSSTTTRATGEGGYFPVGPFGETRLWHGGVHLRADAARRCSRPSRARSSPRA